MIEKYLEKKKDSLIQLENAESGNVVIIERKYDENTGAKVMKPTQETNSTHITELIADNENALQPLIQKRDDLTALLKDVQAKEKERADQTDKANKSEVKE